MGDVIPIHSRRTFSEEEALALLPVVRRITERVASEVESLQEQLRFVPHDEPMHKRLYSQVEMEIRRWAIKISKLGCEPRGIWLVDFDAGDGWFAWRLGDERLAFFHAHDAPQTVAAAPLPEEITT
ncbi:MAG: DUF2203 family protein [bacterium]